jgi:hypothetical protein
MMAHSSHAVDRPKWTRRRKALQWLILVCFGLAGCSPAPAPVVAPTTAPTAISTRTLVVEPEPTLTPIPDPYRIAAGQLQAWDAETAQYLPVPDDQGQPLAADEMRPVEDAWLVFQAGALAAYAAASDGVFLADAEGIIMLTDQTRWHWDAASQQLVAAESEARVEVEPAATLRLENGVVTLPDGTAVLATGQTLFERGLMDEPTGLNGRKLYVPTKSGWQLWQLAPPEAQAFSGGETIAPEIMTLADNKLVVLDKAGRGVVLDPNDIPTLLRQLQETPSLAFNPKARTEAGAVFPGSMAVSEWEAVFPDGVRRGFNLQEKAWVEMYTVSGGQLLKFDDGAHVNLPEAVPADRIVEGPSSTRAVVYQNKMTHILTPNGERIAVSDNKAPFGFYVYTYSPEQNALVQSGENWVDYQIASGGHDVLDLPEGSLPIPVSFVVNNRALGVNWDLYWQNGRMTPFLKGILESRAKEDGVTRFTDNSLILGDVDVWNAANDQSEILPQIEVKKIVYYVTLMNQEKAGELPVPLNNGLTRISNDGSDAFGFDWFYEPNSGTLVMIGEMAGMVGYTDDPQWRVNDTVFGSSRLLCLSRTTLEASKFPAVSRSGRGYFDIGKISIYRTVLESIVGRTRDGWPIGARVGR